MEEEKVKKVLEFWTHLEIFKIPAVREKCRYGFPLEGRKDGRKETFFAVYLAPVRLERLYRFVAENLKLEIDPDIAAESRDLREFTYLACFLTDGRGRIVLKPDEKSGLSPYFSVPPFWIYLSCFLKGKSLPSLEEIFEVMEELAEEMDRELGIFSPAQSAVDYYVLDGACPVFESSENMLVKILKKADDGFKVVVPEKLLENRRIQELVEEASRILEGRVEVRGKEAVELVEELEKRGSVVLVSGDGEMRRKLRDRGVEAGVEENMGPFYSRKDIRTAAVQEEIAAWIARELGMPEVTDILEERRRGGKLLVLVREIASLDPLKEGVFEKLDEEADLLLPSFYLDDLVRAQTSESENLRLYILGRSDAVSVEGEEERILSPENLLPASWPSPGHWNLNFSQQLACQVVLKGMENGGITAVNGPPGTGKTTLLRDIVANVIVRRAEDLIRLDGGFFTEEEERVDPEMSVRFYSVPGGFPGRYEIVVASSNNNAVENITKELPGSGAVDRWWIREFGDDEIFRAVSSISSHLSFDGKKDAWFFITGVLGRRGNVRRFVRRFWRRTKKGAVRTMLDFLNAELGIDPEKEWERSCGRFLELKRSIERYTGFLSNLRKEETRASWVLGPVRRWRKRRFMADLEKREDEAARKLGLQRGEELRKNVWDLLENGFPEDKSRYNLSPWVGIWPGYVRRRLFIEALRIHYLFILRHSREVEYNLSQLMEHLLQGSRIPEGALRHLWATFFIAVPVVSTTFASLGRMFSGLRSPESIGWLVIDEAGQAVPQAAVGGIMRAKRVVVVGDPLQIEPVVETPGAFVSLMAEKAGISEWEDLGLFASGLERAVEVGPGRYLDTSVQVLADRASFFRSRVRLNRLSPDVVVGIPLRVHRRCRDPMFSISNEIAYGGMMIHGKREEEWREREGNRWFHVARRTGRDVWRGNASMDEVRFVVEYLCRMGEEELRKTYVISPFRTVAGEIRNELGRRGERLAEFARANVGTVHTFQGKENDTVILVLGGRTEGARRWAARKPNLFNVAVTRARERLIVVGDYERWRSLEYVREIAERMEVEEVDLSKLPSESSISPACSIQG